MRVFFNVLGEPQGKGRPKFSVVAGHPNVRTPDKTVRYENLIALEYRRQCNGVKFADDARLDMRIKAFYTIPSSAPKKKKALMETGALRPAKKPDMDNILKVVADALNNIAYRDDAQIVDCQVRKYYSNQPRLEVTILTADERTNNHE